MKGKHKIEVRSGRVVFTIELERNITILRGDSATGKQRWLKCCKRTKPTADRAA